VPGVVSIDPGRVAVPAQEVVQGDRSGYRTYTYGSPRYETLTMTVLQAPGMQRLQDWFQRASQQGGAADALRRDISIYVFGRNRSTVVRTFNVFGCFPVSHTGGDQSLASEVRTVTFTCSVGRIEVA
jgi:hypothetical protein